MVPVPEDLVEHVKRFVRTLGDPDAPPLSPGAVAEVVRSADEPTTRLLRVLARGVVDGEPLTVADAARRVGLSTREVIGTITELRQRIVLAGGPHEPFTFGPGGDDPTDLPAYTLLMAADTAALVLDASPGEPAR